MKEQQDISRLVLGTAQLGMGYGIANRSGKPDLKTAESIVKTAWESGIHEFDTAQAYGESERVLGLIFKELGIAEMAKVITKLNLDVDHLDGKFLNQSIESSMNNLGVESLFGLMLHREEMLDLWEKDLERYFMDIVDSGRVKHLGVSVYSPEKAILALNTKGISIVQLPTNVIDTRFEKAGVFKLAEDTGKKIYIRSIFLQGLLLMSPKSLPEHMRFTAPVVNRLAVFAKDNGLTIIELCIGYIKHAFPHLKLVFGAETPEQIRENIKYWNVKWQNDLSLKIQSEFEDVDEMILDPSLWPSSH